MSAVDHLRRIPLFSDLTAEEMMDVLRLAKVVQFAPEARLCTQGSPADCLFIVEEGEGAVRVRDGQGRVREVSRIGPGEVLGELGLVDGQPRSADVIALTALRAYRIDRTEFDRMRAAMHPAASRCSAASPSQSAPACAPSTPPSPTTSSPSRGDGLHNFTIRRA